MWLQLEVGLCRSELHPWQSERKYYAMQETLVIEKVELYGC